MATTNWLIAHCRSEYESRRARVTMVRQMEQMAIQGKVKSTLVSTLVILLGGILGFFLGGTFAAAFVEGQNALSDATTVAISAIASGIGCAAFCLYLVSRSRA